MKHRRGEIKYTSEVVKYCEALEINLSTHWHEHIVLIITWIVLFCKNAPWLIIPLNEMS